MNTPENITELKPNEVFVFGSNTAGLHGAGAAETARRLFGARLGEGCGPTGRCYAIPTKDEFIRTLPLASVKHEVGKFLVYAGDHPDKTFLVTKIGCGLAGFTPAEIGPLFKGHPANVILPIEFEQ